MKRSILKICVVTLFVFLISCEGNKTYYVQDDYRLSINTGDTIVYKESDNYDYYILDSIQQLFDISVSVGSFSTEDKYEILRYYFKSTNENDTLRKKIETNRGGVVFVYWNGVGYSSKYLLNHYDSIELSELFHDVYEFESTNKDSFSILYSYPLGVLAFIEKNDTIFKVP